MSFRALSFLGKSALLFVAACAGGQNVAPSVKPLPREHTADKTAPSPQNAVVVNAPKENPGPCSRRQARLPIPLEAGRGDRVILAKTDQGNLAFVANEDDNAIHTVDLEKHEEVAITELPGAPSSLVFLSDGRIGATLRDRNEVLILEPSLDISRPLDILCRSAVPSEPVGIASYGSDGKENLVVTSGYGHTLSVLDHEALGLVRAVDLPRDPRAVAISGTHAFISHVVSSELSVVALSTGEVESIDLLSKQKITSLVPSQNTSTSLNDHIHGTQVYSLAVNGEGRLFVPMNTVDPGEVKITSAYGGTESPLKPFVGAVDLVARTQIPLPIPGNTTRSLECMLPRAAAARGSRLFVACLGIDTLVELDGNARNAAFAIRKRTRVPAGPLGLALSEHHAIVMSQFDRALTITSIDDDTPPVYIALSRPENGLDAKFERGRRIFHDSFEPRVSSDGRACASCHPDGRDDGNTWSTPDGPRQTISLAGRIPESGPYGWFGNHPTLHSHLTQTMSRLGGLGFGENDQSDLDALATYITRMKAPVVTADPEKAAAIAKGRELFHAPTQGCGECHAEGGSDKGKHNVGSGRELEARLSFDTPSLWAIAGSAPYFHDGRYASLDELLAKGDDRMGHAKHLNAEERSAIATYMESLNPKPAAEMVHATFVRPTEPIVIAPDAKNGLERSILGRKPPRRELQNLPFDLKTLPIIQLEASPAWDKNIATPQGGTQKDLLVWNGWCAAVPYHSAAWLQLDWRSTGMTRRLERCVGTPYEDGKRYWETISVRTLDPLPDGRLHVEEHKGFIHLKTNKTWITESIVADATPIDHGLAFAFRTSCPSCKEGEREHVTVIAPSSAFWPDEYFDWRTLNTDKGHASSYVASFNTPQLERWRLATNVTVETGGKIGSPLVVNFQFETTRSKSEPIALTSLGRSSCVIDNFDCL